MEWPVNNKDILNAIDKLFATGKWWLYKGEKVFEFEKRFAEFHDAKYGVSTCNGTVPLEIILRALEVGKGDKVILPAYNYYSLPGSVSNRGAEPVFVDVTGDNLTIDADLVEKNITPDVKAVVAVHISSSVAELDRLREICDEKGVYLIEDCAQGTGAKYGDRRVGGWSHAGIFSFGGVKLMTCGQGGMITTSDKELYEKCYAIVNRGYRPGIYGRERTMNPYGILGDNYQLSELSAVVLGPQLDTLDELCARREEVMTFLDSVISEIEELTILKQFEKTVFRAQMRYSFYCNLENMTREELTVRAEDIPLTGSFKSVSNDEQQFQLFSSEKKYPQSENAEKTILSIHHTDLLRGIDYWRDGIGKLRKILLQSR